ncbi:N-acetylmuramoyl-L-alanine amidase [Macrococcoides bohemicum]|uniref:N-acetylmuramoyl-L-alanine amidase n=1 Tax=Macrococcoides bohemicum TaxID=1903056 RepID=UPI003AFFF106
MDNKFYYKTPALMLMMFAGTTTAAYAAENEVVKTDSIDSTTNETVNPSTANESKVPVNVIATNDFSDPASIAEQYSLTQVKNNTETASTTQLTTTETPTVEVATAEVPTVDTASTESPTVEAATAEVPTVDTTSTESPTVEAVTTEVLTVDTTSTESPTVEAATAKVPTVDTTSTESPTVEAATAEVPTVDTTSTESPTVEAATAEVSTAAAQPKKTAITITARTRTLGTTATTKAKNIDSMSVNEVIKYNNWAVPVYEKSFFNSPKIAYRNGVAKPEGIVAHETANPTSKIDGEIAYMKRNYTNAFVHAFIDDKRIVEVADTDYISWGAGPVANPRYINVELVRVYGKEAFSRSINNYADYFATNLLYYGLPLDNAHYDGNGTVWNHKAVSNFLGGTDHTDPIGWFQANNYTFDEFYNLVSEKYNYKLNGTMPATPVPTPGNTPPQVTPAPNTTGKVVTTNERRIAKIKWQNTDVYTSVGNPAIAKAGSKSNTAYYVNKKAVLDGVTYYSLTDNKNVPRGWVKAKDTKSFSITPPSKTSKRFTLNSTAKSIYSTPWGSSKQVVGSLKGLTGKEFKTSQFVKVGQTSYYFGTVNALTGWINLNQMTLKSASPSKTAVKITDMKNVSLIGRTDAKKTVLYTDIKSTKKAQTNPVDMQLYINQSAKKNNKQYYGVADPKNKFLGWISDTFIKEKQFKTVSWTKMPYTIKKSSGYIYSIPGGSKSQRIKKLSTLPSNIIQVIRTDKIGNAVWHKVLLDDKTTGYVPASYLFTQNVVKLKAPESLEVAVAKQSSLKNPARNAGPKVVFSTPARVYNERLADDSEIKANMDTKNALNDPELKYQFLDLGQSEGISAKNLNKLLAGKGILENQGATFAVAAKQFKINEIYLIAHALVETGHGKSRLSNGLGINDDNTRIIENATKKYYNTYGTKATDNNVELGGIAYAKNNGWDSVSKAIIGGAEYVRKAYIDNGQRTLHQMRWNPENTATHQYATDVRWAMNNAKNIARLYKSLGLDGLNYIVHEYI